MSESMAGVLGIVLILAVLLGLTLVSALLLTLSAKIFNLPNRSFLKALGCTLLIAFASFALSFLLSLAFGPVGSIVALIGTFFLGGAIISGLYRSGYAAALGTSLLWSVFASIVGCIVSFILSVIGIGILSQIQDLGQNTQRQFQDTANQIDSAGQ